MKALFPVSALSIPGRYLSAWHWCLLVASSPSLPGTFFFVTFNYKIAGTIFDTLVKTNSFVMIFITQLIYIKEGQEDVFHQFEDVAMPLINKYNGRLLLRVRPDDASFIEADMDKPYEIHLVEFDGQQDFDNFKQDEERKKFLHLKEQSIKASIMYQGVQL